MTIKMVSLARCAEMTGLLSHEMLTGVSPGDKHERMLGRYRRQSPDIARARLVAEIRDSLAIEALGRAADLLIVLRGLMMAQKARPGVAPAARRRTPVRFARARWRPNTEFFLERSPQRELREGVVAQLFERRVPHG